MINAHHQFSLQVLKSTTRNFFNRSIFQVLQCMYAYYSTSHQTSFSIATTNHGYASLGFQISRRYGVYNSKLHEG
jgi:hypothetical protein